MKVRKIGEGTHPRAAVKLESFAAGSRRNGSRALAWVAFGLIFAREGGRAACSEARAIVRAGEARK